MKRWLGGKGGIRVWERVWEFDCVYWSDSCCWWAKFSWEEARVDSVSGMNPFAALRVELRERQWAKNGCKQGGCGR